MIEKAPKGIGRCLPRVRFILVDINHLKPSEVELPGNLAVQVYRLERSKSQEQVKQELLGLFEELGKPGRSEVMRAFLTWLRRVRLPSRFPELELPELRQEEKNTMLEERVRRWTEQWKAEGHQAGLQAGLKQGEAATLIRQLEFKFGSLSADRRERIRAADSSKLHEWTRRILTAARLEEVFDPADFQVQS